MIYPKHFEEKTGFDKIRELIAGECISEMGKQFVGKIRFSSNAEVLVKILEQAEEFKQILQFGKPFPTNNFFDLREYLRGIQTPGSYIEKEPLFDLRASLRTIQEVLIYIEKLNHGEFPRIKSMTDELYFPKDILKEANRIIDDKGEINDNASEKLREIRKQIITKQRQVLKATKKAFDLAKKSGWIPENADITVRNGRSVIPVKASDKRALHGFIHDESSTGQTVFVEPGESFEINNEIRELENDERREIIKILTQFTDRLRPFLNDLFQLYRFLGLIDFIRAKALFAIKTESCKPIITAEKKILLQQAKHPLLLLAHKAQNKEVVPLDMELDSNTRILVISGPNAGGKSVCLKTAGLLQYMLQCGLLIPVKEDSEFYLFDRLFIDIGDEQSLENDLSTYSSHLLNMKYFLRHANENSLFLIDEFGTGTEPQLGGAIAEAVLEELNKKEAFGVVTTHYTNLKIAAEKNSGMINGAMLFDSKEMQPLYKLQVGKPGSSFTFEIARKIGFPKYVLQKAKKKSGNKAVSFDQQLQQLELEKLKLEKKEKALTSAERKLNETLAKYEQLKKNLEQSKKVILEKANQQALEIIESSNKAIEKTIREIKEGKADKKVTKEARQKLELKKENLKNKKENTAAKTSVTQNKKNEEQQPVPGDWVKIKDSDIVGELISIDGDDALVNVNSVRLRTSASKLEKSSSGPKASSTFKSSRQGIMHDINKKAVNFNLSIDLRGKRADEAMSILKKYIDDAILLNIKEVSILHGKGYGILRDIIREYLQSVEEVHRFGDAPLDMGGSGITRVVFR
ncbi:MAG: endonuclease MutS2 [Bacteroidetes bacterium]|nr:MAG: endonuclease MutS2 [Bacteroidota bacterium]